MQFQLASDNHERIFATWSQVSPLEERTCRPILNGKRISPNKEVVTFSFKIDGIEELVGRFAYFDINTRNHSAEFGYTINPRLRRRGMGTEMLNIAITHLFLTTTLNKLYCQTAAFNIASIKLLEKLNFNQDGVLREHHELDGKLWDDYIYSVLRRDWREINLERFSVGTQIAQDSKDISPAWDDADGEVDDG
jgi:[ribosomal protein S5]-alanine N-acetyltransferase